MRAKRGLLTGDMRPEVLLEIDYEKQGGGQAIQYKFLIGTYLSSNVLSLKEKHVIVYRH